MTIFVQKLFLSGFSKTFQLNNVHETVMSINLKIKPAMIEAR